MFSSLSLLTFFVILNTGKGFEQFLARDHGDIEKGNFTYFRMDYDGTIMLELVSVKGDCDLYVSQEKNKPTYDPNSYCLQSATCGLDSVIVPKKFKRPVWIGVFAHPSHEVCSYQLSFFEVSDSRDIFNYDPHSNSPISSLNFPDKFQEYLKQTEEEEKEESFLWKYFCTFVRILIENSI